MRIACATDDRENFSGGHFGDANYYYIYDITEDSVKLYKTIDNTYDKEEEGHADPKKAKGILSILLKHNINATLTSVYGANISRIAKKILPIISKNKNMEESLEEIKNEYKQIKELIDHDSHITYNMKIKSAQKLIKK